MFNRLTPLSGAALLFLLTPGAATAEVDLAEGRTIFNETAQPPCAVCPLPCIRADKPTNGPRHRP